ncbi:MFS transporter [Prevotella bivia]|uniref:Transporter, major facilitator family protein n=1 Tax=Prevotella bivia TaxID=28125 RepID=A0A137SYB4_9BACT|nr:MFS transporter [Prevotella bivia]KXO17362.1 transporter, major facilitator family protein [Prevotella bivia]
MTNKTRLILKENEGIPRSLLIMMAIVAGITVGNLYYNQPLLEIIKNDLHTSEILTNLITVITQIGYALGLCFIVPMGDMFSRRTIITVCLITATIMCLTISFATHIYIMWGASIVLGIVSIVPQLFIPLAGQYSRPAHKSRNMGVVLSGLLTGILASRVISGFVGQWLSWRAMFLIAAGLMVVCLWATLHFLPFTQCNFERNYKNLMLSVVSIFRKSPQIRYNSVRAALAFGAMLTLWSCLAFHLANAPFYASSNMVGILGLCGVTGAVAASGVGKLIPRVGVQKFSVLGAILQLCAWAIAYYFGDTYIGLIVAIIICDLGTQCIQLSNQGACIQDIPNAANRVNTIFMTIYFIGGSLGTFFAGLGWKHAEWTGICLMGSIFTMLSLLISGIIDWRKKR